MERVWGLNQAQPSFLFASNDLETIERVSWFLRFVFAPLLIAVGFLGNALVITVTSRSKLIKQPPMLIITAIAAVDLTFLLSLTLVWVGRLSAALTVSVGWCESVDFLSRSSSFLSVWFHFLLACERCMTQCRDRIERIDVTSRCRTTDSTCTLTTPECTLAYDWTTLRTKCALILTAGVGVIAHLNLCLTVSYKMEADYAFCMPLLHLSPHLTVLDKLDIAFNLLLPYSVLLALLIRLAVALARGTRPEATSSETPAQRHDLKLQRRFTVSAVALCSVFLLFNTPSQVHRMLLLNPDNHPTIPLPLRDYLSSTILHALYCSRFALMLPVLLVTSAPFRCALLRHTFCRAGRDAMKGSGNERSAFAAGGSRDRTDTNDLGDTTIKLCIKTNANEGVVTSSSAEVLESSL